MYGDIPFERFFMHSWRNGLRHVGTVPASFVKEVSQGVYASDIEVEVDQRLFMGYDLILSIGQVVPHEVAGMANHNKNIFVGCGGNGIINASHVLGAFYGMERMMGRADTPVRRVFDYAEEHFLSGLPIYYALTVTTAPGGSIRTHGLFIGRGKGGFYEAVRLAQKHNLTLVDEPFRKAVVYLDEAEFKSMWLGNKAIYRTRMAMADGGNLIILAPGVEKFGEDSGIDALIRKYGYKGREYIINRCGDEKCADLLANMSAAAHLIHGSSDGRFRITYCTKRLTGEEVRSAGFEYMPYDEAVRLYDPQRLKDGYNVLPSGERVFYISNPALGLWADKSKY